MTRKLRDRDTFPGAHPPVDEAGPDLEPAPARPDGYRYERPHIADSAVHRLLDGLGATRFPRSTTLSETDGQLAAHYHAGPRQVPPATDTPMPQPSVLVSTVTHPGSTVVDETLLTIPKKRSWMPVAAALLGAIGMTVFVLTFVQGHGRGHGAGATVVAPPTTQSAAVATTATVTGAVVDVPGPPEPAAPDDAPPPPVSATPRVQPRVVTAPAGPATAFRRAAPRSAEPDVPRSSKTDREE